LWNPLLRLPPLQESQQILRRITRIFRVCTTQLQSLSMSLQESRRLFHDSKVVKNYSTWSFGVKMYLIDCGLWDTIARPDILKTQVSQAIFDRRDEQARAKICLTTAESLYPAVSSAKTAKETWDLLQRQYADSGLSRRLGLDEEFIGVIMLAGLSDEYKPMVMALEHSGAPITGDAVGNYASTGRRSDNDD
ncbi:hypothetical protein ACJJTC_000036, partial [Scirpophaga incertulas]